MNWDYVGGDSCSKLFKWFTNGIHGKKGEIKSNRNKLSTTIHLDLWPYSTVQQLGIKYAYNLLGELWDLKEKMRLFIWHLSLLLLRLFYSLVFVFLLSISLSICFSFNFWFRFGSGFVYNVQWMRCSSFWVLSKNKIPQRAHIACACVCLCLSLILILYIFIYRLVLRVNPLHAITISFTQTPSI